MPTYEEAMKGYKKFEIIKLYRNQNPDKETERTGYCVSRISIPQLYTLLFNLAHSNIFGATYNTGCVISSVIGDFIFGKQGDTPRINQDGSNFYHLVEVYHQPNDDTQKSSVDTWMLYSNLKFLTDELAHLAAIEIITRALMSKVNDHSIVSDSGYRDELFIIMQLLENILTPNTLLSDTAKFPTLVEIYTSKMPGYHAINYAGIESLLTKYLCGAKKKLGDIRQRMLDSENKGVVNPFVGLAAMLTYIYGDRLFDSLNRSNQVSVNIVSWDLRDERFTEYGTNQAFNKCFSWTNCLIHDMMSKHE